MVNQRTAVVADSAHDGRARDQPQIARDCRECPSLSMPTGISAGLLGQHRPALGSGALLDPGLLPRHWLVAAPDSLAQAQPHPLPERADIAYQRIPRAVLPDHHSAPVTVTPLRWS